MARGAAKRRSDGRTAQVADRDGFGPVPSDQPSFRWNQRRAPPPPSSRQGTAAEGIEGAGPAFAGFGDARTDAQGIGQAWARRQAATGSDFADLSRQLLGFDVPGFDLLGDLG